MREIFLPLACFLAFTLLLQTAVINVAANDDAETKAYIVYMGERKHTEVEKITESHHEMLSSVLGSKEAALDSMIYTYKYGFSAFAAKMTESQAKYFEGLPGVVKVFQNRFYKLHTTRSQGFLNEAGTSSTTPTPPMPHSTPLTTEDLIDAKLTDDGVIIGVLDTGIWPESESFNDRGLGPIPARWKGFCQAGQAFIPAQHCNRKLIGARYFIRGFLAAYGKPYNATANNDYLSPRDGNGHGTHVTSTAGGALVSNVSRSGLASGTAQGNSPRARLAMYKVSWRGLISSVDTLKAFDEAINDGVDVLSLSFGFELPLYPETDKRDVIYYGSFHAVRSGITVVCSAGNTGSLSETVINVAPWVITVGASTLDRLFPSPIILGNNAILTGQSMFVGQDTGVVNLAFFRDSADAEGPVYCEKLTATDTWVSGKVILCFTLKQEDDVIVKAARTVFTAGGLGLIATRKTVDSLHHFYSNFPTVLVTFEVGTTILNYIRSTTNPKVRLRPARTYIGEEASTYVASFSSRGPNSLSPAILKPDVAAPGVDIIAAYRPDITNTRGYTFLSGTSQACPHISGVVARLKALHPNWSPAAMKSAITTSAWSFDPYSGEPIYARGMITKAANPFDYGGGLANPTGAKTPGLVYDMGTQDYVNYLCAMGYPQNSINQLTGRPCLTSGRNSILDFNLPSITIPTLRDSVTVTRTVTNVGNPNSKYRAFIDAPPGTLVTVNPKTLVFSPKVRTMRFRVNITTFHNITTEYYFGWLTWADGTHNVKTPISVRTVSHTSLW